MIDSTLFGIDIPAGSYSPGDTVQLKLIDGPATVRSGRGAAILKRLTVGLLADVTGSSSNWKVSVKNSDWVDPMTSMAVSIRHSTALDERTGCIQSGNNCTLTPNSSWEVFAVCTNTVTTTVDNSLFALLDIDYPSVSSIVNPDALTGIPATIECDTTGTTIAASGTLESSTSENISVDIFKAGYMYALQKVESIGTAGFVGFISISDAAGMAGLKRIIPIASIVEAIRNKIEYASSLVKGPMTIGLRLFANSGTGTTGNITILMDFVKRRM